MFCNIFQISTSGYIVLGSKYNRKNTPSTFPPGVKIIAPYWTDIDLSEGNGSFFINEYSEFTNITDSLSDLISNHTSIYGNIADFTPSYMLICTWKDVQPYPAKNYKDVDFHATFQVVLATDGSQSVVLYHYHRNDMAWKKDSVDRAIVLGYSNGDANVEYLNVSDKFRPDRNSNVGEYLAVLAI